jgi:hypothetical protein
MADWKIPITGRMWVTICHRQMKMSVMWLRKRFNFKVNYLVCYDQLDSLKKVTMRICYIIKYSWSKVTRMWPVMEFLQIFQEATCQLRGRQVRNVILIRLALSWPRISQSAAQSVILCRVGLRRCGHNCSLIQSCRSCYARLDSIVAGTTTLDRECLKALNNRE